MPGLVVSEASTAAAADRWADRLRHMKKPATTVAAQHGVCGQLAQRITSGSEHSPAAASSFRVPYKEKGPSHLQPRHLPQQRR